MATVFSHAIVGCTLVSLLPKKFQTRTNYFLAAFTAILPDFDYIGFISRVPYDSLWGHRGMTHSIVFAVVVGLLCAIVVSLYQFKKINFMTAALSVLFFLTTISHGLLDACTNGGLGVAFYAPYDTLRYFFPWRPIQVSPMGLGFFSERGLMVLLSEVYWVLIPCALIVSVRMIFKNRAVSN
jgi:inner membrane protein